MNHQARTFAAFAAVAGAALAASACQQPASVTANVATNAVASNGIASAPAPATPPPTPAAPDPADATGPLALATDSNLPEPCRTYIREAQACLDNLTEPDEAFKAGWVRTTVHSSRESWAGAADDSYRGRVCAQHLESLREGTRTMFQCAR